MSSQNSITIRFIPKGDKQLRLAIENLAKAQGKLEGRTKEVNRELRKLSRSTQLPAKFMRITQKRADGLSKSFATLRSRLLLFSFAASLGGRQLLNFGKNAGTVEDLERAFTNLAGGSAQAADMQAKLGEATNGTMSQMDLFQQANSAMVLGVTKNADEMAEMFDIAQRLGKALGRDTASSIESMTTGIGRQSRLMLDNIGIIVRVDDANKKFANSLGINVSQLTDSQKRQAFFNATLEAGRRKLQSSGEEVFSTTQKFEQFEAAASNLGVRIGELVNVALIPLIEFLTKVFNAIDLEMLASLATGLGVASTAFGVFKIATIGVTTALKGMMKFLGGTGVLLPIIALGAGIGLLIDQFGLFKGEFDEEPVNNFEKAVNKLTLAETKLALVQEKRFLRSAEKVRDALKLENISEQNVPDSVFKRGSEFSETMGVIINQATDANTALMGMMDLEDAKIQKSKEKIAEFEAQIKTFTEAGVTSTDELANLQDKYAGLYQKTLEARRANLDTQIKEIQNNKHTITDEKERIAVLANLNKQLTNLDPAFKSTSTQIRSMSSALASAAVNGQNMGKAVVNSLKQIIATFLSNRLAFGILSAIFPTAGLVAPTLFGAEIFHNGGMVQSYHGGGSAGNVPAVLQEGEFVMRRSAVESIGQENLNRMNRTGTGAVNVTFTGNVMSQDFIESEAIPAIKKAVRRGADLGIS